MVFNLALTNNTILSDFIFLFVLIIYLHFLICAVITKISNPFAKFAVPMGIQLKAKVETEAHPVTTEIRLSDYWM